METITADEMTFTRHGAFGEYVGPNGRQKWATVLARVHGERAPEVFARLAPLALLRAPVVVRDEAETFTGRVVTVEARVECHEAGGRMQTEFRVLGEIDGVNRGDIVLSSLLGPEVPGIQEAAVRLADEFIASELA